MEFIVSLLNDYLHLANTYSSSNSLFRYQLYIFYLALRGELDLGLWNLADKKLSPSSGVEEVRLLQHQSLKTTTTKRYRMKLTLL